jgi:hypothetical protein
MQEEAMSTRETWCRNATLASLRTSNGSHQRLLPLATIRIPSFKQEGWRISDVGVGTRTITIAMLATGRKIDAYWPVEADEHARSIGNNITKSLETQYKAQLAPDFLRPTLPQDIKLITGQMVIDISPIHLSSANWHSSDIAGAAADRTRTAANSDETRGRIIYV